MPLQNFDSIFLLVCCHMFASESVRQSVSPCLQTGLGVLNLAEGATRKKIAIFLNPILCLPGSRRSVSGRVEAVDLEPNPDHQRRDIQKLDV